MSSNEISNEVRVINLRDSGLYEDCVDNVPQIPYATYGSVVERVHGQILSCGGIVDYQEGLVKPTDLCFVFDR